MIDREIRRMIDPALDRVARGLAVTGLSANTITWLGFAAGLLAGCFVIRQSFWLAFAFVSLNRLADGLDGAMARQSKPTDLGGFLDIVLDFIFYSWIPLSFAIGNAANALPAAFLIHSFAGTGGSFLAFAVISAKRGVTSDGDRKKSFFYSRGLMEGTETVIFLMTICIFPDHFAVLAWIYGSLCWLTTAIRIGVGMKVFGSTP